MQEYLKAVKAGENADLPPNNAYCWGLNEESTQKQLEVQEKKEGHY